MANTINAMDVGMTVPVNCQAVVSKLRSMQRTFGSDEDGLLLWKVQLQEQKMEEARIRDANNIKQVRKQRVQDKARSFFSADDMDTIEKNKDAVLAFIQLLEKDDVEHAGLQGLRQCKEGSTHAAKLVEDLLRSQMKLSDIGEEMLLPKLLAALSRPESNLNDWPVMIQTMYDFAMVMSAKDPRGIRWKGSTKDLFAWIYVQAGKQVVGNLCGYAWSNVNADDDAGKLSRQQKRRHASMDQDADADDNNEAEPGAQQPATQKPRFNFPVPSKSTLKAHIRKASEATKNAGILANELQELTQEVVKRGNDAGIIYFAFDKVHLAQQHPGDGCTGEGETDCAGLLHGAGMDLAARMAWLADRRADVHLLVTDMRSRPAILAWYKKIEETKTDIIPMLEESFGKHDARLKKKQLNAKSKCNDALGTKFSSYEEAMSSTDAEVKKQMNKSSAAQDIVLESKEMCHQAIRIFERVLAEVQRALDIQTTSACADDELAHEGLVTQKIELGPNAVYDDAILQRSVQDLQVAVTASYIGCMRQTATQAFVVVAGETNRDPDISARPVLVLFVNSEHNPEKLAPSLTALSVMVGEHGYHDAIMHCADGEFASMCRKDSEGGHTRICTRYAQWAACMEQTAREQRSDLLEILPAEYMKRYQSVPNSCICVSVCMRACMYVHV